MVKDEDTTTADAANYNAILISETSTANEVGDKFRDVPQAVVIYEHNLYDDMDMANPDDRTRPAIEILDNTHPITLGLPLGSLTIFDRNQRHAAGNVGGQSTATILATTDNRASLYVYEQVCGLQIVVVVVLGLRSEIAHSTPAFPAPLPLPCARMHRATPSATAAWRRASGWGSRSTVTRSPTSRSRATR